MSAETDYTVLVHKNGKRAGQAASVSFWTGMGSPQGEYVFAEGVNPKVAEQFAYKVARVIDQINKGAI